MVLYWSGSGRNFPQKSDRWNGEEGSVFSLHSFMSYALYGIMSYCVSFMDIRRYRIPNRALAAAAAAGLAVSVEARCQEPGMLGYGRQAYPGFLDAGYWFWAAAAEGRCCIL